MTARLSSSSMNTVRKGIEKVRTNASDQKNNRIRKPGG